MSKTSSDTSRPQSLGGKGSRDLPSSAPQQRQFVSLALTMGWQLAVVVLVPIIGGVELDKAFDTSPILLLIGLGLAVLGSIFVMWHAMQTANSLPVPKLNEAQHRAVQKQYEEDDE